LSLIPNLLTTQILESPSSLPWSCFPDLKMSSRTQQNPWLVDGRRNLKQATGQLKSPDNKKLGFPMRLDANQSKDQGIKARVSKEQVHEQGPKVMLITTEYVSATIVLGSRPNMEMRRLDSTGQEESFADSRDDYEGEEDVFAAIK